LRRAGASSSSSSSSSALHPDVGSGGSDTAGARQPGMGVGPLRVGTCLERSKPTMSCMEGGVNGRTKPAPTVEHPRSFPEQLQQRAEAITERADSVAVERTEEEGPRELVGQLPRACRYRASQRVDGEVGTALLVWSLVRVGRPSVSLRGGQREARRGKQRGQPSSTRGWRPEAVTGAGAAPGQAMPCCACLELAEAKPRRVKW
jgi:hypothetical protein